MTLELGTRSRTGIDSKLKTLQSKQIKELASVAVSCIKNRIRKRTSTLEFRHFIMNCLTDKDVTKELIDRFKPTQHEYNVAMIAITLYRCEIMLGGRKKGKFFKEFLNECMMLEDFSPEICEMYGIK
jgi:hypothetical protein